MSRDFFQVKCTKYTHSVCLKGTLHVKFRLNISVHIIAVVNRLYLVLKKNND